MFKDFDYFIPVKLVFGPGRLTETGPEVGRLGKRALIVTTGSFFEETGLVKRLKSLLEESGVESRLYRDISPNPLNTEVDRAAEYGRAEECDVIIGLGGGSAIDAAKGIAVVLGHDRPIWEYCIGDNRPKITAKTLPVVAIATTAGTGSEATRGAVITNAETKEKPGFGSDHTYPRLSIVDPELMLSMPPQLTAATGIDALSHAIESYTSQRASPISELYCEQAFRLIGRYLRRAVSEGQDLESRSGMALASTLAGLGITVAKTTICHALGHSIGGVAGTTHGETLACLTPHTIRLSMGKAPERFARIGRLIEGETDGDRIRTPEESVRVIERLIRDVGMAKGLAEMGVRKADLGMIADGALRYMTPCFEMDLADATREDLMAILEKAY
jgi:alcohol dehydrogenase class IV